MLAGLLTTYTPHTMEPFYLIFYSHLFYCFQSPFSRSKYEEIFIYTTSDTKVNTICLILEHLSTTLKTERLYGI